MKNGVIKISAVLGILVLVFMVVRIGPVKILSILKDFDLVNLMILVFLRILYWLLRTISWKAVVDSLGEKLSLMHLFHARMSGHAISQLTPTSQIGSEAARLLLINTSSKKISAASVIIDKTIEFFSIIFMTVTGMITAFLTVSMPEKIKIISVVSLSLFGLGLFYVFIKQKSGILCWAVGILDKLRLKIGFIEKNRNKFRETDDYIGGFYKKHNATFIRAFLLYILLILLWTVEIFLILKYLGVSDVSFADSFILTTLGNIAFVFPFIPGSIGVYEATYIGLCALIGINAGMAIAVVFIRRLIALMLAGFGLFSLWKLGSLRRDFLTKK